MSGALKICFAASEVAPFAKTGGLADVSAALPLELHRQGHDIKLFMPCYSGLETEGQELEPLAALVDVPVASDRHGARFTLRTGALPGTDLTVYFIDCPELYHRASIYSQDRDEYRRFAFFSSAVLLACQRLQWSPHVFHSNDWHLGLLPFQARTAYEWDSLFQASRHLFTIHNIGYQGIFDATIVDEVGLGPWAYLLDQDDLHAGRVNFLKTGLIYAHAITTVSPTYAQEIQSESLGMGLDPLLRARRERLFGILNGVDYDEWSPAKDRFIRHRYSPSRLHGKTKNKLHLLRELGLPEDPTRPLFGMISRLTHQKGIDLCEGALPRMLQGSDAALVVLGSGQPEYETFFTRLQQRFPGRVVYYRGYNNELSHLIEAGADFFIMPSLYEPSGLNQMFSLKYGTIPIVRRTGGLADSVEPFDPVSGTGTGIVFEHYSETGLLWALDHALRLYGAPNSLKQARRNAMGVDHSWRRRTKEYVELYRRLVAEAPREGQ